MKRAGPGAGSFRRVGVRRACATHGLAGLLAAAFALELLAAGPELDGSRLLPATNLPVRVLEGQVHRLVTANFLHSSLGHLVRNLVLILVFGRLVERLLGWRMWLGVVAGGGIFGHAAASLFFASTPIALMGASAVAYALLAAHGALRFAARRSLPRSFFFPWPYLALVALLVGHEVLDPREGTIGHVMGALWGLAWGVGAALRGKLPPARGHRSGDPDGIVQPAPRSADTACAPARPARLHGPCRSRTLARIRGESGGGPAPCSSGSTTTSSTRDCCSTCRRRTAAPPART